MPPEIEQRPIQLRIFLVVALGLVAVIERCQPPAWNCSWNDSPDNPSAAGAVIRVMEDRCGRSHSDVGQRARSSFVCASVRSRLKRTPGSRGCGDMTRIRVLLAAMAVPVTIAALVLAAQGARRRPRECSNGTYHGYCATQIDNGTPVLVMDNSKQREAVEDNPVVGWTDSSTDPATNWVQLAYAGDNSLGVMFFWAPTGVNLNLCVADPGNGHVVLRVCNGSNWQRWIAAPVGSTGSSPGRTAPRTGSCSPGPRARSW